MIEENIRKYLENLGFEVLKMQHIDLGDSKIIEVYVPKEQYPSVEKAIELSYKMYVEGVYPEEYSVFIYPDEAEEEELEEVEYVF